jgi:arsenate reductase
MRNGLMPYNVLFLCTGSSARSVMAEALLNFWGRGRFRAFSAGSHPKGEVHPMALEALERSHLPTDGARSKSGDEFARPEAPPLDFVFTVCGNAAQEQCPHWPGQPVTAHWGVDDPAAVEGSEAERRRAFHRAFQELDARIKLFTSLRLESLDRLALKKQLDEIGHSSLAAESNRSGSGGEGSPDHVAPDNHEFRSADPSLLVHARRIGKPRYGRRASR